MFSQDQRIDFQGALLAPVGRCIYCGSDGGTDGLRDEHVVPYALGGNTILPSASCAACEAITSYLDGYLTRGIFLDLRLQTGIQTRRPKERPKERPVTFETESGDRTLVVPVRDHPHFVHLPIWGPPGIMAGEQLTCH